MVEPVVFLSSRSRFRQHEVLDNPYEELEKNFESDYSVLVFRILLQPYAGTGSVGSCRSRRTDPTRI